jgi:hypothetical protein
MHGLRGDVLRVISRTAQRACEETWNQKKKQLLI